jgi:ElaB/YqjD/DUF883 family membrane-anchored ribosome-binding protein
MARATRRIAAAVTPILAAVALVGCGGGTSTKEKNAYAQQVNAAQTKFATTVTTAAAGEAKGEQGVAGLQRTLRRFHTAVDGVVQDLRHIDAPSEVSTEHERLVSVMGAYGDEIGQTIDEMRNPTPQVAERAKQRLDVAQRSVTAQVNAAIAAINVKLRGE